MHSKTELLDSLPSCPASSGAGGARKKGVLLLNLGTPDAPDKESVRKYLVEFLGDPYVVRLPKRLGWMQPIVGRLIAHFRAKESAKLYRSIWTPEGSPLRVISDMQAVALEELLPAGWSVFLAMRYGLPGIADALEQIRDSGINELVVVPMYPQFAGPTTGTALEQFYAAVQRIGLDINISVRTVWYDDTSYIGAQASLLRSYFAAHRLTPESSYLLFSAHSMPVSYIKQGDPYLQHITRTVELVRQKLDWPADRQQVAFQSRLGPVEWLSPALDETLDKLARSGEKSVVVCPISFTADCLETLQEIGMLYREQFETHGGRLFLCPALNDSKPFISAMRNLVLRGSQRCVSSELEFGQSQGSPINGRMSAASLFMVGISLPNRTGADDSPALEFVDADTLRSTKLSAAEVEGVLKALCADGFFSETFIWNTCNRFECYGWVPKGANAPHPETIEVEMLRRVFGEGDHSETSINVLRDREAIHHLMRTSLGLNSELPGEKDIADQLQAALRVARAAGTAGPLTEALISKAREVEGHLRRTTGWGKFTSSYCSALISRLRRQVDLNLQQQRIAVIGRSNTALSLLELLTEEYQVPTDQITFIHKGSRRDGQIKKMRRLLPRGRKIRVDSYSDAIVLKIVARSDLIIYGIDQPQPVLRGSELQPFLQGEFRPRVIVDFNTFGSTVDVADIPGITLWEAPRIQAEISSYADELCVNDGFWTAVEQVEARLAGRMKDICDGYEMDVRGRSVAGEPASTRESRLIQLDANERYNAS